LKLTELSPTVVEAFFKDEIGVGHVLLLARLQPARRKRPSTNASGKNGWAQKVELRKVCAHAECPVHHPKEEAKADDAKWKAEQEAGKQEAIARATGLRVLKSIGDAVPVRLMNSNCCL
jgi:hypothetical protein